MTKLQALVSRVPTSVVSALYTRLFSAGARVSLRIFSLQVFRRSESKPTLSLPLLCFGIKLLARVRNSLSLSFSRCLILTQYPLALVK